MKNDVNKNLYGIADSIQSEYRQGNEVIIGKRWDLKACFWDMQLEDKSHHLNQDDAYSEFIDISRSILINYRKPSMRVLDVGCGTGLVIQGILDLYDSVVGIDVSQKMIDFALRKNINNAAFYKKSIFDLPSQEARDFDVILSRGILISHYSKDNSIALMNALYKSSVSDGIVIIDFLNKSVSGNYNHIPTNKNYFEKEAIEAIAKMVGFTKVEFRGESGSRTLFAVLYKNLN